MRVIEPAQGSQETTSSLTGRNAGQPQFTIHSTEWFCNLVKLQEEQDFFCKAQPACLFSFSLLNTIKHFHLVSFPNMERRLLEICLSDNSSFASGKKDVLLKNKAVNVSKFSGT